MGWERKPNLDPFVIGRQAVGRMMKGSSWQPADRQDAVQEAAIAAMKAMASFDKRNLPGGPKGKKGYALAAAWRHLRKFCAKRRKDPRPAPRVGVCLPMKGGQEEVEKIHLIRWMITELEKAEPLWGLIVRELMFPQTVSVTLAKRVSDKETIATLSALFSLSEEEVKSALVGAEMFFEGLRLRRLGEER